MSDTFNTPNAIAKTLILKSQQLKLWCPTGEIINQIEIKSEENQLDNIKILKAISRNTKRLKLQVFTKAKKSVESAIGQHVA